MLRERQYVCAIRPIGEGLILHTMHYVDEVVKSEDAIPAAVARAKTNPREVEAAEKLIDSMTAKLDLSKFHDEYREKLEEMIERRKHGETMEVSDEVEERAPARTVNLMDALRRSLKAGVSHNGNGRGNGHVTARRRIARTKRRAHARNR